MSRRPTPRARAAGGAQAKQEQATTEPQATQEQILDVRFEHSVLLVPKIDREEPETTTIAPAAVRRAFQAKNLELRAPSKNAPNALQRIGLEDVEKLQSTRTPPSHKGGFARLNSLGMTAAMFAGGKDEDDARNELDDQYEFVPNFQLSLPARVQMEAVPATRGRLALNVREWPEESGIAHAHAQGIRGAGVLVGVLDTGIDADHDEFAHQTVTYRYVSPDPSSPFWPPRDVRGFDTDGHGTHVSGIIAGRGVGVAPEATLYVASVIESETTRTSLIRVAYGLDWVLRQFSRPDNEHRPAVLNMSLGFPPTAPPGISRTEFDQRLRVMRTMLRTLIQANVFLAIAIGNDGPGRFGYPGAYNDVVAVGAVDFGSQIASFSGSGNPPNEGASKPDLVGYGVGVYSSVERDYEGNSVYQRFNGTSMATPYVTGLATLYRCQYPTLTADQTQQKILANCVPLTPKSRMGAGLARFVP